MSGLSELKAVFKSRFPYIKLHQYYYRHLQKGKEIYLGLLQKYGDNCRIYINHYPGTGDIYLTSSLLPAWVEKNGVDDYVITVIGKSAEKVAKLFSIEKIEILTKRETEDLLHYLQTIGEMNPNLEVLHFSPFAFHQKFMDNFLGVNGNQFMQMYLNVTFPGLTVEDMQLPDEDDSEEEINRIFEERRLLPGNTVLLVPYANTIDPLSKQFWTYLADGFLQKGYTVCTNCDYPREKPIKGTIPLFLRYNQLQHFVEKAGTIVQLRSGLTDLLCRAKCRNYILYPVENYFRFGRASLYEYFSLAGMGLSDTAIELEFSRRNESKVYKRILKDYPDIVTWPDQ